nr:MAG TPA: hypothetical protein [Caudoviricetes sp.]
MAQCIYVDKPRHSNSLLEESVNLGRRGGFDGDHRCHRVPARAIPDDIHTRINAVRGISGLDVVHVTCSRSGRQSRVVFNRALVMHGTGNLILRRIAAQIDVHRLAGDRNGLAVHGDLFDHIHLCARRNAVYLRKLLFGHQAISRCRGLHISRVLSGNAESRNVTLGDLHSCDDVTGCISRDLVQTCGKCARSRSRMRVDGRFGMLPLVVLLATAVAPAEMASSLLKCALLMRPSSVAEARAYSFCGIVIVPRDAPDLLLSVTVVPAISMPAAKMPSALP